MDSNIETWLPSQARYLTAQWEQSLKRFFPQFAPDWEDPDRHMRAHQEQWNYMDAAKILKWESLLHGTGLEVLDLGAGTGWLAALLSQYPSVGAVETLDSSDFNMRVMVPAIFARMGGDAAKLKRIVGFFTPIQREDQCYDLVVASSAAHHAPDLVSLFRECHRVLKPGGKLVLLNEVPIPRRRYIWLGTGIFLKAMYSVVRRRYKEHTKMISSTGILYDPFLGDIAYCMHHWIRALELSQFRTVSIKTGLRPYKKGGTAFELVHFVATQDALGHQTASQGH